MSEKNALDEKLSPYWKRMQPLGELRCRVLACLNADNPNFPCFFDPPQSEDLHEAFVTHLTEIFDQYQPSATGPQFNHLAIVAAGLLTCGQLNRVDYIIENLPPHPIELDHGCGWGNVLAFRIVAELLPFPRRMQNYFKWFEGSDAVDELRNWIASYRADLIWSASDEQFILSQ